MSCNYKGTLRLHSTAMMKISSSKQNMSEYGREPVPVIDIQVIEDDGSYFEISIFGENGGDILMEFIRNEATRLLDDI